MPSSQPETGGDGPSKRSGKSQRRPRPGYSSSTIDGNSPEVVARLILKGHRNQPREMLRRHPDPALFSLQVGLTLGILMDSPLRGYHTLRQLLTDV